MDRHFKERLVGAAVLVAAANILIPEMLSGPREPSNVQADDKSANDGALKTYTIDLQAPKTQDAIQNAPLPLPAPADQTVEVAPAPPEEKVASSAVELPKSTAEKTALEATDKAVPEKNTAEKPASQNAVTKPVAVKNDNAVSAKRPEQAAATPRTANAGEQWAVQVASFSARANADKAVAELKAKGHTAFVSAFQSKGQTLYRVRVGPAGDRAAADAVLHKVKVLYPGANVVVHP